MIMRKIAALVFVFLLCMVVTACGGDDKKTVLADGSYIIKASQGGVDMEQYYDKTKRFSDPEAPCGLCPG